MRLTEMRRISTSRPSERPGPALAGFNSSWSAWRGYFWVRIGQAQDPGVAYYNASKDMTLDQFNLQPNPARFSNIFQVPKVQCWDITWNGW